MMRAYTSIYLAATCLLHLSACSEASPADDAPFLYDNKQPDPEPTNCTLDGTWQITLSTADTCSPETAAAAIILTVATEDAGSQDFTTDEPKPTSSCGPYAQQIGITANGCTITASSLATWCSADKPQCSDYQLELKVHDDTADVKGTYRKCWCGSPSAFGKKVQIAGSATRL